MAIRFRCGCGRQLQTADEAGGKQARCPLCGAIVPVPPAPDPRTVFDRVHFLCRCGERVTARVYHHAPTKEIPVPPEVDAHLAVIDILT